jgi:flotillin
MRQEQKRFGRVSAKPSEYLIKLRRGRVVAHGPGLSVFLWPWESYTLLPTAIQQVSFVADQITSEKVGVAVTGIAVYRLAEPLLAFRMLDFSAGEEATDHLATILREMFIGAARRLVANMTIEQCLTQRKENIAQELMREIQPVVSGQGRAEDATDQGWGIILDTIEIQDVRILSERVFADLQTPYRARLELQARIAQVQRDQELHLRQVESEHAALTVDQELSRRRTEAEGTQRMQALADEERLALATLEGQSRVADQQLKTDLIAQERARQRAESDFALKQHLATQEAALQRQQVEEASQLALQQTAGHGALKRTKLEERLAREEMRSVVALRLARQKVEMERLQGELQSWLARQVKEVENLLPDQRLHYEYITRGLPAVAEAFARSLGPVQLTQISSNGEQANGLSFIAEAMAQVLAVGQTLLGGEGSKTKS